MQIPKNEVKFKKVFQIRLFGFIIYPTYFQRLLNMSADVNPPRRNFFTAPNWALREFLELNPRMGEQALQWFSRQKVIRMKDVTKLISCLPATSAANPRLLQTIAAINNNVTHFIITYPIDKWKIPIKILSKMVKECINNGNEAIAVTLVEHDVFIKNIDKRLLDAAEKGFNALCAALLKKGANPNVADCIGYTPLYAALNLDNTALTLLLLDYGADPNFKTKKQLSPLWMASVRGNQIAVKALIQKGAHLDALTVCGETAIHWTCKQGHLDVLKTLVESGADPEIPDKYGKTPADMARFYYHDDLAAYIKITLLIKKTVLIIKRVGILLENSP